MKRSHRLGLALAAAAPLLLGGCQTSNVDTAMQLMQQQQQEQALAQQREDADERKRLAAKPELALSLIREAQRKGATSPRWPTSMPTARISATRPRWRSCAPTPCA